MYFLQIFSVRDVSRLFTIIRGCAKYILNSLYTEVPANPQSSQPGIFTVDILTCHVETQL